MALLTTFLNLYMIFGLIYDITLNCIKTKANSQVHCASVMYPPPQSHIPEYVINLDLPPKQRWAELTPIYETQIRVLLDVLRNLTQPFFHGIIFKSVNKYLPRIVPMLPYPFADELRGIADVTGIPLGEVVLYNLFYELSPICTSIVAQSESGQIFHGRNLDFGFLLGWNHSSHTWLVTEALRALTVKLNFHRNGRPLFMSTTFVGYVGILTALKPGAFSLTIDAKLEFPQNYIAIVKWLLGRENATFMGFLNRQICENATGYFEVQKMLVETKLIAGAYFIVGGNRTGQACVITNGYKTLDIWEIGTTNFTWFLVETNYDHWKKPPCYDDRRKPAVHCMTELGQKNLSFSGLFNVLSTQPVLNQLTTYTTLMEVTSGAYEVHLQYCRDKCGII